MRNQKLVYVPFSSPVLSSLEELGKDKQGPCLTKLTYAKIRKIYIPSLMKDFALCELKTRKGGHTGSRIFFVFRFTKQLERYFLAYKDMNYRRTELDPWEEEKRQSWKIESYPPVTVSKGKDLWYLSKGDNLIGGVFYLVKV
jgi:hypothetical protein